jgi:hypothetical protein
MQIPKMQSRMQRSVCTVMSRAEDVLAKNVVTGTDNDRARPRFARTRRTASFTTFARSGGSLARSSFLARVRMERHDHAFADRHAHLVVTTTAVDLADLDLRVRRFRQRGFVQEAHRIRQGKCWFVHLSHQ